MGMGRDVGVMRMSESRLLDALPRHAVARERTAQLSRRAVDGDYGRISARAKRVAADRERETEEFRASKTHSALVDQSYQFTVNQDVKSVPVSCRARAQPPSPRRFDCPSLP